MCLVVVSMAGAAEEPPLTRAWQAIVDSRSKDVFRAIDAGTADRAGRLARAAAYFDLQPISDDSMRKAEVILADLAKGDDEIALQAAYLQARLYQLHFSTPDFAKAANLFEQLAARAPDSHWAQLGLVKLGMLKLYAGASPATGGAERMALAGALLAKIKEPALRRDLELQIGRAGLLLKQPLDRVLPHLIEADRIGGISGTAAEDLIVQIGELSYRNGQFAQSRVYFERYVKTYPRNLRAYSVQRRLEEIAGHEAGRPKGGS